MLRVLAHASERDLMRAERPFDALAVDDLRPRPPLRRPQHDHRPVDRTGRGRSPSPDRLDTADLLDGDVHRLGHGAVHAARIAARDHVRRVAVAAQQLQQLPPGNAVEDRRTGDLRAVQMEDREDRAVARRIEELVRVPARRQRPGFRLAVTDDAGDDQPGIVEGGAIRMGERVAELAAFMDRAGGLGRDVARDAARERELLEEAPHPFGIPADVGIDLGVRPFQPRVGDRSRAAVPRPQDVDHVEAVFADHAIQVDVDEVEAGGRSPVPQQAGLDVRRRQRLFEKWILEEVDLPDRKVVGGAPPGVERVHAFILTTTTVMSSCCIAPAANESAARKSLSISSCAAQGIAALAAAAR